MPKICFLPSICSCSWETIWLCTCNKDINPNLNGIHPCVIYHPWLCFVIDQSSWTWDFLSWYTTLRSLTIDYVIFQVNVSTRIQLYTVWVLRIFHELQNSWDLPSFVHQKNRQFNLLGNCDFLKKYSKNYNWNVVKDDVKSKVGWLKKRGFLLVI